jgi:hypothetical protein
VSWAEKKLAEIGAAVADEGDRTRMEMAAALAQTVRGLRINGARPRPITPNAVNVGAGGRLVGWSLLATGGPVRILLHDGGAASADLIAVIDLADQENQSQWMGPGGIAFAEALYVECTGAGTLTGALHIGAVD